MLKLAGSKFEPKVERTFFLYYLGIDLGVSLKKIFLKILLEKVPYVLNKKSNFAKNSKIFIDQN